MIARRRLRFELGTLGRHAVGIVKADQARAIRCVQRERVGQAVRSLLGCLDALDFKLYPIALFEMVNAPIEREQEFESVLAVHIMSRHDNKVLHLPSQWATGRWATGRCTDLQPVHKRVHTSSEPPRREGRPTSSE